MVTQRAEIANLMPTVSSADAGNKQGTSLTESFQSYIAGSSDTFSQNSNSMLQQSSKTSTEYSQKDVYDKVSTETYSKNVDQVKEQMQKIDASSKQTVDSDYPSDIDADMESVQEALNEVEASIRDVIKSNMDMTDEEIDEVLAEMDISIFQLLQPDVLQEFLMTETGTEPIDILTNSDLIDVLQVMNQGMETIRMDAEGMDVQQLISEVAEQEVNLADEVTEWDASAIVEQDVLEIADDMQESLSHAETSTLAKGEASVKQNDIGDTKETNVTSAQDETTGIQVTVQSTDTKKEQADSQSYGQQEQSFAGDVVNQLSQAVDEVNDTVSSYVSELEQQDIVQQVVEQIKIWNSSETSRMQVQLYPEHLGRVEVQVMLKNGTMTAQITAETEMAKAAIESQLQSLKESFQEKNIQVDAVEVSVGTPDFRNEQERQDTAKKEPNNGTRNRRVHNNGWMDSDSEVEEAEDDEQERLNAQGASVEFTA